MQNINAVRALNAIVTKPEADDTYTHDHTLDRDITEHVGATPLGLWIDDH